MPDGRGKPLSAADMEQLRIANARLAATVQELKLEIAYYKGETKRLELEKNLLNQDVSRMSTLFKNWLTELQSSSARNVVRDSHYINNIVKNPCRSICELLQLNDQILFVTSCQPPFHIEGEVMNRALSSLYVTSHSLTDHVTARDFIKDVTELGYANMHIVNYRKDGQAYEVDVVAYPVFDSISPVGPEAEVVVLTHFASILTNFKEMPNACAMECATSSDSSVARTDHPSNGDSSSNGDSRGTTMMDVSSSDDYHPMATEHSEKLPGDHQEAETRSNNSSSDNNSNSNSSSSRKAISETTSATNFTSSDSRSTSNSEKKPFEDSNRNPIYIGTIGDDDRRHRSSKRMEARCKLSAENFYHFGDTLRLSNLLRLMLSCTNAMMLLDNQGRIVHVNVAFTQLTGYELDDIEGQTSKILQGAETNDVLIRQCQHAMETAQTFEMVVYHYKHNGDRFLDRLTMVPIRGGYLNARVTHFCALLTMMDESSSGSESGGLDSSDTYSNTGSSQTKSSSGSDGNHSDGSSRDGLNAVRNVTVQNFTRVGDSHSEPSSLSSSNANSSQGNSAPSSSNGNSVNGSDSDSGAVSSDDAGVENSKRRDGERGILNPNTSKQSEDDLFSHNNEGGDNSFINMPHIVGEPLTAADADALGMQAVNSGLSTGSGSDSGNNEGGRNHEKGAVEDSLIINNGKNQSCNNTSGSKLLAAHHNHSAPYANMAAVHSAAFPAGHHNPTNGNGSHISANSSSRGGSVHSASNEDSDDEIEEEDLRRSHPNNNGSVNKKKRPYRHEDNLSHDVGSSKDENGSASTSPVNPNFKSMTKRRRGGGGPTESPPA
eukprot:scaffold385_cov182-Ochromonas_danica.AAC.5